MKLKTRLLIAFLTILLMPIVLFTVVGMVAVNAQFMMLKKTYQIEGNIDVLTSSSFRVLTQISNMLEARVEDKIREDADQFLDEAFLNELNEGCSKRNSYLVLRIEGEYTYIGRKDIPETLLDEAVRDDELDIYAYAEKNRQIYSTADITFSDGRRGQVFVFTFTDSMAPETHRFIVELFILVMLVLFATAAVLVLWIYRSIIRPIRAMRVAAQNIRDGNLDFEITPQDDEMGELAADIDEMRLRLKESVEEKLEYDAESKRLVGNISHDLKTPITAIKGYVEGIMDGVADTPEKMDKYIRTIYTKANEMDKLIDELMLYAKIDTNRIPYNFVRLNVAEYFEDCAYDIRLELEAKGIEFGYFNYIAEDVMVIADPEQLRRVINNIISNSVKYMDKEKALINIRLSETEDSILIEEEDNGKGIAAKDLPNIFDRFYRTDSSRNSAQGGSGIGLAIVKKIIEDHGGRIWATSKEGTGTVMHIVLRKYEEPLQEVTYEQDIDR